MKKLTLLLIAILTSLGIYAQDVKVSGKVISSLDGEPLIGATVMVKGTATGTATDVDGAFTINAPQG
ncbi:MAG: carboxypeptidase-like regulatory domain-containing protein, partial [Muribaculaceae bacterium]|nr:carboxypeptidase-like regulatory domain-containing protein [Muribaculaceae bacterium]